MIDGASTLLGRLTAMALGVAVALSGVACGSKKKDDHGDSSAAPGPQAPAGTPENPLVVEWTGVEFAFVSPDTADDVAKPQIDVEISVKNLPAEATWSLYYGSGFRSTEGGTLIAGPQPIATSKVTWNTDGLTPGTYFLYVVLNYGGSLNIRYYESSITIDEPGGGNRTPFVRVTSTGIQNHVWFPGNVINLDFQSVDPDGDPLTLAVQYSSDDGATWTTIKDGLTAESEELTPVPNTEDLRYVWTVPAGLPESARYALRVAATDGGGKTGSGAAPGKFGMAAGQTVWLTDILPIVNAKCAGSGCHVGQATPQKNLRMENFDQPTINNKTYESFNSRRTQILQRTRSDALSPMPPTGATPLTQAEIDRIQFWDWTQGQTNQSRLAGSVRPAFSDLDPDPNATRQISLTDPAAADPAPQLTSVTNGQDLKISWKIADTDGDNLTYELAYAAVGSNNFTTITPAPTSGTASTPTDVSYTWTAVPLTTGSYRIRLIVTDGKGRWVTANSANFAVP